jgi:hypothetical protein
MVNSTNGREHRLLLYASHKTLFASDVEVRVSASAVGGLRRLPWGGSWSRARSRGMTQAPSQNRVDRRRPHRPFVRACDVSPFHSNVQIFLVPPTRSPTQTAELPRKVVITSELHTANSRTTDPSPAEESSSQYLLVSSPKLSFIDE